MRNKVFLGAMQKEMQRRWSRNTLSGFENLGDLEKVRPSESMGVLNLNEAESSRLTGVIVSRRRIQISGTRVSINNSGSNIRRWNGVGSFVYDRNEMSEKMDEELHGCA